MNTETTSSEEKRTFFWCRILGHQWHSNTLVRTCRRCGKIQNSRFRTNTWVDV
ncbi:hypothetical protein [Microscilla marina]|uniref:hypothetical protein n=1 Tax=Microscilla marina TaxID=1027 RepID=UPI0018DD41B9|nr:hypothetical protein [Microscilla marina]